MSISDPLAKLNQALKDSGKKALKRHASFNQPIVFRDDKDQLVEKYYDGKIVVILKSQTSCTLNK